MAKKTQFKPVSSHVNFPKLEEGILKYWEKEKIFEKSLENRKKAKKFTFYDGPPFATGLPHYGHILAMTIKDAITRLKTMQGYYVPRRLGWDTHGLPVEYEMEKELGISGKHDIEKMGVGKFNEACRSIVFRYTKEWEKTIERMGRWADKKNTYSTLNTDYMESIWWVFKSLWDKKLVYKGFKSMPYCPRCATPLSNFETNLGYKDGVEDPSVYVKFQSADDPKTFYLAWTTTPWTLPGNAALAVNPKIKYVKVKVGQEFLILAKSRLEVLDVYEQVEEYDAAKIVGKSYTPLFPYFEEAKKLQWEKVVLAKEDLQKQPFKIVAAGFVSTEDGTGIVHVAPAFGEDDMSLGKSHNLPLIQPVNKYGQLTVAPYEGIFVKKADKMIIKNLNEANNLYKAETIRHTYPFCWRCETPLLYYAIANWFVKVSEHARELVKNNQKVEWTPSHIKEGRFGKWIAEPRDWSISRNRFWGAPLPVWQCEKCHETTVVGSVFELKEKAYNFEDLVADSKSLFEKGLQKSTTEQVDLHRPHIDKVIVRCAKCGGSAKRVEEVLDCWFESGSMPYAQDHYPFENKKEWEENFPADFIAEGLDQTRGWFYTLHVLASLLFDKPAFKNIVVNGIVVDRDGKKLSKRLRNYPEPNEVFEKFGADAMRFYLLSSPATVAEDVRFSAEAVEETVRKFFIVLWNVYSFFTTYANVHSWQQPKTTKISKHVLDKWVISRLNQTISNMTKASDEYHLPKMIRPLSDLLSDISNWYVRRSRDRVSATASKEEIEDTLNTLHFTLVEFSKLVAPFAPFTVDEIFRNLTEEESVHLADWPKVNEKFIDKKLEVEMQRAREVVEKAHALRKMHQIKIRQPLPMLTYDQETLSEEIEQIIAGELNIKEVKKGATFTLDTKLTQKLKEEGAARDIIRSIQQARKDAAFGLTDMADVHLPSWPKELEGLIKKETLTKKLTVDDNFFVQKAK